MRRGTWPVSVALAAAALVSTGHANIASGHALILESTPRPAEAIPFAFARFVLRFNSRIEHALSRVWLQGPDGTRVQVPVRSDVAPDLLIAPAPTLAPGAYLLEWRVLSADGHVTQGSFPFRVVPAP